MKSVCLLGSTGSIGVQALDVIKSLNINVLAIAANENIALLERQAREFRPRVVCVRNKKYYSKLKESLKDCNVVVVAGEDELLNLCSLNCDIVLNAIVGVAGLKPTVCALNNKKDVALANKESLVVAGEIVVNIEKKNGCKIIPVDSEHSAIFQCITFGGPCEVNKIILTASGGPFFGKTRKFLENVSVCDALKHPNWSMGKKITIDSATMMNKGLELIEAVWLFNKKPQDIKIVVHPQSVLHSAVEYVDGSVIAHFSKPNMRLAIQYALTYPNRLPSLVGGFSFEDCGSISFFKPDYYTFPCLKLCEQAIEKGGIYPAILNAANEKAVELFLEGRIKFLDIEKLVEKALEIEHINKNLTIESVLELDFLVKKFVEGLC